MEGSAAGVAGAFFSCATGAVWPALAGFACGWAKVRAGNRVDAMRRARTLDVRTRILGPLRPVSDEAFFPVGTGIAILDLFFSGTLESFLGSSDTPMSW